VTTSVPNGWEIATLADLGSYHNGRGFKKAEWSQAGRPIIRIQNLTDPSKPFNRFDGAVDPRHEVRRGDILVSWAATLDAFRWEGDEAVLNQHIFKVESSIEREFHFWLLKDALDLVRRQTHGTAIVHVTREKFLSTPVLLPPAHERARILEELTEKVARVDAGERSLSSARTRCAALRLSLLNQVAPDGAPRIRIGDLGTVSVGATPSRKDPSLWDGDIPWVSSGEVAFCRISDTKEHITDAGLGNRAKRLHPPGTVMLAMIGEGKTRGQAAILDVAAAHNQNSAAIRLDRDKMLPEFLFYALMRQYEDNRRGGSGSQQPALNGDLVRGIEVACPSLKEQRELVAKVEGELDAVTRVEQSIDFALARVGVLRRSVIHQALSGETNGGFSAEAPVTVLATL
jgi:type I restriction enzyme S subunit